MRVAGDADGVGGIGAGQAVVVDDDPVPQALQRAAEAVYGHAEAAHRLAAFHRMVELAQSAAQVAVVLDEDVLLEVLEKEQNRPVPVQVEQPPLCTQSHLLSLDLRLGKDCRSEIAGQPEARVSP